ncbi:DNA cytosine methyltransferase [Sporanaerobacter acetigenes]|uniref:Cytosine-specific methyltransferase n=1 Tax=Sporanaerobacter acetigenes DSM 13106 TaxID=1123281 RepID=A0A1M5YZN4_9FIRM|nr:DNA cytosine methyltransferase [Sporanaerobacter acetigenes]SHI17486.1 DNA (cytosine-5)-methyltransferase 1 [Sporanaerobacter acetigenes DSM 13106]
MIKGISLFANVGIAETYLRDVGVDIVIANEMLEERAKFYKHLYPSCKMITGDITNKIIFEQIIKESEEQNVEFILATPPCQGMSLAGSKDPDDERNYLIIWVVKAIKRLKPKYALIENVTQQLKTQIRVKGKSIGIPDYIKAELGVDYNINKDQILNTKYYGVPQQRKRAIILLARKDTNKLWEFPPKEKKIVTLEEAIGDLPSLDPEVREKEYRNFFPAFEKKKRKGLAVSKWHFPPKHVWRNVEVMMHTPTGCSARKNPVYFPKKPDGTMVGGAPRTYMRMDWEKPAPTVTRYNSTISSFQNVHPGRKIEGTNLYSDARVLTILELLRITTLPDDWNIPEWASIPLIRDVIGEGIPPLAVKKIVKQLDIK